MENKQKYCDCEECKDCCKRLPGIPLPDEVIKIAKFLNMPLLDCLKKYFIVGWRDYITINGKTYERIEFVYPAREGWNNKIEDWGYPFPSSKSYCLFLENGLCKINPVKPFECLKVFGCKSTHNDNKLPHRYRDIVLLEWNKVWKNNTIHPDIKKFIQSKNH